MASINFNKDTISEISLDWTDFLYEKPELDDFLYKPPTPGFELQLNMPRCNGKSESAWENILDQMINIKNLKKQRMRRQEYTPKKIIQNGPAIIVFWNDNTKTIIRRKEGDPDDIYAAFGQALMKKIFSTNSNAHKVIDRVYVNPFMKHIQDGLREIDTNSDDN